jgi:hypothetical protein
MEMVGNLLHDVQLVRRAAVLVAASRNDLQDWRARNVAAAQVNIWIGTDLCRMATAAAATAVQLRAESFRLRTEMQRRRNASTG